MMVAPLILASGSPRRRELLELLGIPFRVLTSNADEAQLDGETPEVYARRLSVQKAAAAQELISEPALILAADTIVVDGVDVLGKPAHIEEAISILRRLRARTHQVITAVTLLDAASGARLTNAVVSPVTMRAYTEFEIAAYVATGDPFDKAGGYAIQHPDFRPVADFDHCYANVMGLPLCRVGVLLSKVGVSLSPEAQLACRIHLGYPCPLA